MTREQLAGYALAAGALVWGWLKANSAEIVALVEKYSHTKDEKALEVAAVHLAAKSLPGVPAALVRWLIRRVCARRKARAKKAGIRSATHG